MTVMSRMLLGILKKLNRAKRLDNWRSCFGGDRRGDAGMFTALSNRGVAGGGYLFLVHFFHGTNSFRSVLFFLMSGNDIYLLAAMKSSAQNLMKKRKLSDRVIEYILSCDNKDIASLTIKQVANTFAVSQSFLYRKFKSEKYFSLGEFLLKEKMFRAANLLLENQKLPVKVITEMIGFSTSDYFIRVFKKHYGVCPNLYRKCKQRDSRKESQID